MRGCHGVVGSLLDLRYCGVFCDSRIGIGPEGRDEGILRKGQRPFVGIGSERDFVAWRGGGGCSRAGELRLARNSLNKCLSWT